MHAARNLVTFEIFVRRQKLFKTGTYDPSNRLANGPNSNDEKMTTLDIQAIISKAFLLPKQAVNCSRPGFLLFATISCFIH